MTDFAPQITPSVADKDVARTFAESGLSLSHSSTKVSNESISFKASKGTTVDRGPDWGSTSSTGVQTYGVKFSPNVDLAGIEIKLGQNAPSTQDVFIVDLNENLLVEDTSGHTGGDVIRLKTPLTANSSYYVGQYDNGTQITETYPETSSFPYTSADLDMTAGAKWSHPNDGQVVSETTTAHNIRTITGLHAPTSGTVHAEWSMPDDVYAWDTAWYQSTEDGATVDVYVEEDQSSGWTEIAGPLRRGDSIPADPANNVRYRVDISRPDASSNPTLDSIARRWKL